MFGQLTCYIWDKLLPVELLGEITNWSKGIIRCVTLSFPFKFAGVHLGYLENVNAIQIVGKPPFQMFHLSTHSNSKMLCQVECVLRLVVEHGNMEASHCQVVAIYQSPEWRIILDYLHSCFSPSLAWKLRLVGFNIHLYQGYRMYQKIG